MTDMVRAADLPTPRLIREMGRTTQAKALLTNREIARREAGTFLERALSIAGLTIKQAAALIGTARGSDLDPAQLSRWIAGTERFHFDAIYAVPEIAQPFLTMAMVGLGATTETTIRFEERKLA